MRHQKKTIKLGRTAEHRKALLANQVCSLIEHQRIKTTLAKAKAVRPLAEKMVTLGKRGSIHARRTALATLRQKNAIKKLFDDIAPRSTERNGGYTRIVKLGRRKSDSSPMAFIEWVDAAPVDRGKRGKEGETKSGRAKRKTKRTCPPTRRARSRRKGTDTGAGRRGEAKKAKMVRPKIGGAGRIISWRPELPGTL